MRTVEDVINTVKSRISCGSSVSPRVPSLRNKPESQLQQSSQCMLVTLVIMLQCACMAHPVQYTDCQEFARAGFCGLHDVI